MPPNWTTLSSTDTSTVQSTRSCKSSIWIILLFLMILAFILVLFFVYRSNSHRIDEGASLNDPLLRYAKLLNESIDQTCSPCFDFFQHACGNWAVGRSVTEQTKQLDHGMLLMRYTNEQLQAALKNGTDDGKPNAHSGAMRYLMQLYRECIDMRQRQQVGIEPAQTLVQELIGGHWPITQGDSQGTLHDDRWMDLVVSFLMLGSAPVLSIAIDMNPFSVHTKVIKISKSTALSFGSWKKPNADDKIFAKVHRLMNRIFPVPSDDKAHLKNVNATIRQLMHFEQSLFKKHTFVRNEKAVMLTLHALKRRTNQLIDWTTLLNRLAAHANASKRFNDSEEVMVSDIAFIAEMANVLAVTPLRVVKNFFAWKFLSDTQNLLDNGTGHNTPAWKQCLNLMQKGNAFTLALSQFYVLHYDKQSALPHMVAAIGELIDHIKHEYEVKILNTKDSSLDIATQKRALIKLKAMKQLIGFVDWIRDVGEINRRYRMDNETQIEVIKGQFFRSYFQWLTHDLSVRFQNFQNNQSLHWFKQFNSINAYYYQLKNTIFVPLGILHAPFFHLEYPAVINYASIGSILGHEIGHAFDLQGHNYDEHGNRVDWWSAYSKSHFVQRSNCYKKQYSAITDAFTGLKLNGTRCLNENMADNSGIQRAFGAWRRHMGDSPERQNLPPQLAFLDPAKLFFLAYAQVWCGYYTVDYLFSSIKKDYHVPNMYRVNVPLMNFAEFSKTFNCSTSSPMNPPIKCRPAY